VEEDKRFVLPHGKKTYILHIIHRLHSTNGLEELKEPPHSGSRADFALDYNEFELGQTLTLISSNI